MSLYQEHLDLYSCEFLIAISLACTVSCQYAVAVLVHCHRVFRCTCLVCAAMSVILIVHWIIKIH